MRDGWRVEWREPFDGGGELLLMVERCRDAHAARSFALRLGETALGGEFRIVRPDGEGVITGLAAIRAWRACAGGLPDDAPRSLWAADDRRERAVRTVLHAVRGALVDAARAGIIDLADALALVRIVGQLTAC